MKSLSALLLLLGLFLAHGVLAGGSLSLNQAAHLQPGSLHTVAEHYSRQITADTATVLAAQQAVGCEQHLQGSDNCMGTDCQLTSCATVVYAAQLQPRFASTHSSGPGLISWQQVIFEERDPASIYRPPRA